MISEDKNSVSADNRGVSPVIGVILMVAITVILAAVIGGFVLGLGGDLQSAPQAQLDASSFAAGGGNEAVEISHNGGDAITVGDLDVKFDSDPAQDFESAADSSPSPDSEFQVGDTFQFSGATLGGDGEVRVQLIHTPSESILIDTTVEA